MISLRWTMAKLLPVTIRPPLGERANAVSPRSMTSGSATLIGVNSTPSDGATDWIAPSWPLPDARPRSRRIAASVTRGTSSLSSSSHFPLMPNSNTENPVILPPGRAKLSTNALPTGSATCANTIGTLRDASHVDSGAPISICRVVAIAHQPALFDKFAIDVHGGDGVTHRQRDNLLEPAGKERIGTNKKRAGAPLPHGGEGGVDLARRAGIENEQLPAKGARGLQRVASRARGFRKFRIHQQRDHRSIGNELVQQPQRLACDLAVEPAHAGDVAARPVEARDVALLDRVACSREHDRNSLGRCHSRQYRSATSCRGDHVDLVVDQISCKGRQPIVPIFCKTVFNRHVTAIDIARFTQATAERRRQVGPIIWPQAVQEPDHRHRQLLRARRERPRRRRAGHERDELAAATHSITSSARKRGHS